MLNERFLVLPGSGVPCDLPGSKIKHCAARRSLDGKRSLFFFGLPRNVNRDERARFQSQMLAEESVASNFRTSISAKRPP